MNNLRLLKTQKSIIGMIFFNETTAIKGIWIMNLLIASMLASRLKEQNKGKLKKNVNDASFGLNKSEKIRLG